MSTSTAPMTPTKALLRLSDDFLRYEFAYKVVVKVLGSLLASAGFSIRDYSVVPLTEFTPFTYVYSNLFRNEKILDKVMNALADLHIRVDGKELAKNRFKVFLDLPLELAIVHLPTELGKVAVRLSSVQNVLPSNNKQVDKSVNEGRIADATVLVRASPSVPVAVHGKGRQGRTPKPTGGKALTITEVNPPKNLSLLTREHLLAWVRGLLHEHKASQKGNPGLAPSDRGYIYHCFMASTAIDTIGTACVAKGVEMRTEPCSVASKVRAYFYYGGSPAPSKSSPDPKVREVELKPEDDRKEASLTVDPPPVEATTQKAEKLDIPRVDPIPSTSGQDLKLEEGSISECLARVASALEKGLLRQSPSGVAKSMVEVVEAKGIWFFTAEANGNSPMNLKELTSPDLQELFTAILDQVLPR